MEITNDVKRYNSASNHETVKSAEALVSNSSTTSGDKGPLISISDEAKTLYVSNKNGPESNDLPRYLLLSEDTPEANWSSGNVFDFLTSDDKDVLKEAYTYATENNLDHDNVGEAAFFLAADRQSEAMIRSGVLYSIHVPTENEGTFVPQHSSASSVKSDSDAPLQNLRERLSAGKIFGDNEVLNQTLFFQPVKNILNLDTKELAQLFDVSTKAEPSNGFTQKGRNQGY